MDDLERDEFARIIERNFPVSTRGDRVLGIVFLVALLAASAWFFYALWRLL